MGDRGFYPENAVSAYVFDIRYQPGGLNDSVNMPQISEYVPELWLFREFGYLCALSVTAVFHHKGGIIIMLIIDSKDCENIDKALKKYKKKFEKSRTLLQLRERQSFTKPSVGRRTQVLKSRLQAADRIWQAGELIKRSRSYNCPPVSRLSLTLDTGFWRPNPS